MSSKYNFPTKWPNKSQHNNKMRPGPKYFENEPYQHKSAHSNNNIWQHKHPPNIHSKIQQNITT